MPPQIVRLVLLTVGIVGSYLVARYFLPPASFGEYGWYRGAALEELTARPLAYGGKKSCEECHSEEVEKLSKSSHKGLSCEGCHGPAREHAENPDGPKPPKLHYSECVRCHEFNPSRPKTHKQIVLRKHYTGQSCTECHVPHQPTEVP